jgi:predicted heme/steroid binding protein/uncharacterized membrane protein
MEEGAMKEFDEQELSEYNGRDGKPVYIAHKGNVYDVSQSKLWRTGLHMKRHPAGKDLTTDIQAAPHAEEVFERFPRVGILKKEVPDINIPAVLAWLITKVPFLRRHPHPMTVHFPIVFVLSTTAFTFLYLITGIKSLELTALHCLAAGIFSTVVAITTGLYTWWLNYLAKPLRPVRIKMPLTLTLLVLEIIVFVWRIRVPTVLDIINPAAIIYLLLILSFVPIIFIIGWYGASMTFPVEKE